MSEGSNHILDTRTVDDVDEVTIYYLYCTKAILSLSIANMSH